MKVITFSRHFPAYHPKAGQPTHFVEKIHAGLDRWRDDAFLNLQIKEWFDLEVWWETRLRKHHTIRAGHRWKVGDKFSPRIWSGRPYFTKQIEFAPSLEVVKVIPISYECGNWMSGLTILHSDTMMKIAHNDGLSILDFMDWFQCPIKQFDGQIIIWNPAINY
jgi:hypothetical protein